MFNISRLLQFTLFLLTCMSSPYTYADKAEQGDKRLYGHWMMSCTDMPSLGSIDISSDGNLMDVNNNQILIGFTIKTIGQDFYLYLTSPADLGAGGMNLPWSSFSTNEAIAKLHMLSHQQMSFTWYGFYHEMEEKYYWQANHDFLLQTDGDTDTVTLQRCND